MQNSTDRQRAAARTAEQRTATAMDAEIEQLASAAQRHGITDARWNKLALALLGVRQFTRPLMHDDDRRQS
jgi:hypothetical protein